jgi:hypothetical protein
MIKITTKALIKGEAEMNTELAKKKLPLALIALMGR